MKKLIFFWAPTLFTYNYKSIFYNKKNKFFLNLQSNVFWTSISWFSYKLTTAQEVKLSNLKYIKKKKLIIIFLKKIIINNFWLSFTTTDLVFFYKYNLNNILFLLKTKYKNLLEVMLVDKSYFSFLTDINTTKEILLNTNNYISFNKQKFIKNQNIFPLKYSSNLKYFLAKYFSLYTGLKETKINFSKFNSIQLPIENFHKFFFEKWIFIFFKKNLWKDLKFSIFLDIIKNLNLNNAVVFLNGEFFMLNDFFFFKYNFNHFFKKKIEISLFKIFNKIFKKTNFIIFSQNFIKNYKTNLYSLLLSKFYLFNIYNLLYFVIFILNYKIQKVINKILFILQKWLFIFLCQP